MNRAITYIVTGCTGFVGSVLTKKLLAEGCSVIGFARSAKKTERVFPDQKPQFVFGDITNAADVEKLFVGDREFIVLHTAAKVTIGEGDSAEAERVTVGGTKNVVDACCKFHVKKLVHISTTEVLPENVDENVHYTPNPKGKKKGYARAKSEADAIVLSAVQEKNLDACLLHLSCVLGPGDYTGGHISQMFIDYIEGRLPASIKGGYSIVDVRDIADVLPQIIKQSKQGESYIFAGKLSAINDLLAPVCQKLNKKKLATLPIWVAYLGLPFLSLYAKIRKKRPLYTAMALSTVKNATELPIQKTIDAFSYNPRPLEDTVNDHVQFLLDNGMAKA